jgi:hypothetical protein
VHDFNILLSQLGRSSRQKFNKETSQLNDNTDLIDLTDIHKPFYPTAAEYTFFSVAPGTFSEIDQRKT